MKNIVKVYLILILIGGTFFACSQYDTEVAKPEAPANATVTTEAEAEAEINARHNQMEIDHENYLKSIGGVEVLDKQMADSYKKHPISIDETDAKPNATSSDLGTALLSFAVEGFGNYLLGVSLDATVGSWLGLAANAQPALSAQEISAIVAANITANDIINAESVLNQSRTDIQRGDYKIAITGLESLLSKFLAHSPYTAPDVVMTLSLLNIAYSKEAKKEGSTLGAIINNKTRYHDDVRRVYDLYNGAGVNPITKVGFFNYAPSEATQSARVAFYGSLMNKFNLPPGWENYPGYDSEPINGSQVDFLRIKLFNEYHKWEHPSIGSYRLLPSSANLHAFAGIDVSYVTNYLVTNKTTSSIGFEPGKYKWVFDSAKGAYGISVSRYDDGQYYNLVAPSGPYSDRLVGFIQAPFNQNNYREWVLIPYGKGNFFYLYNTAFQQYAYQNDNYGVYDYRVRLGQGLIEGGHAAASGPNGLKSLFQLR